MISKTVHRRAKLKTLSDSGGPGGFDGFCKFTKSPTLA